MASKKQTYFAFDRMLKEAGFELWRSSSHVIYRHPSSGTSVSLSRSMMGTRSFNNQLAQVRKAIRDAQKQQEQGQ